jgi:hypothetical protein
MTDKVTIADMRSHVERVAQRHEISCCDHWIKRPCDSYSIRERDGGADEIQIAPIKSRLSYATALHELGHILGRYQDSTYSLTRERWAWEWARRNALIWSDAMERYAINALQWIKDHNQTP